MHIAITADPMIPVPPLLYGGIERIIDMLARGYVERGHEVTLFAHSDSNTAGRLVPYGGVHPSKPVDVARNGDVNAPGSCPVGWRPSEPSAGTVGSGDPSN